METTNSPGTQQLPSSIEEVVALIIQLYQPGEVEKVVKIQETLQKLQRSPDGWQLANRLTNHENEHVRFFGALTFTVKLNTDSQSLEEEDAEALLQTLVNWLLRCVENSEKPIVMRKLCSTLVAYFIQFSESWENSVKHLLYCLRVKQARPYASLAEAPDTPLLVQGISDTQAIAIFWFAQTLVEDISKVESSAMKHHNFHQRVVPNVNDIVPLISKFINNTAPSSMETKVRREAMKCFQSWVSYSHRAFIDDGIFLEPLQVLTKPAIMCLADENLYEVSMELLSDTLSNYSKFFSQEDFQLMYALFNSPWSQERYQRLLQGDLEFDFQQFGLFMIAFGDATLQDLATKKDSQCQQFLTALSGLLSAEGYAVHEDKIFVPALEFWSSFVENMVDDTYSKPGQHPPWFASAQMHVIRAIERCWHKLQFPPPNVFSTWDSVDCIGFKDARRDFKDLLQQFYLITGIQILDLFIGLAQKAVQDKNWGALEASLFCLSAFPDNISDAAQRDEYLNKIFDASIFSLFEDPSKEVPLQTVQGFLLMINGYADYFVQNTTYLPTVLNIVFGALATPALSYKASRTIVKLCSDCRSLLVPELGSFLRQYESLATNSSLDKYVKETIMEAIASLIQAIPEEQDKVAPLEQLLNFVELDINSLSILTTEGLVQNSNNHSSSTKAPHDEVLEIGLGSLRCLTGIGKGLQIPVDAPVDLEETENESSFWTTGGGSGIQQRVFSMVVTVYDTLRNHGDIIEAACHVWRQGFRELEPGPFVMPPAMIGQFILKADPNTPRLGCMIGTACSLATSHTSGPGVDEVLSALLQWISQILQMQGDPSNEPEVAQNGIDFLSRLLSKYLNTLMNHEPKSSLEFLFMFTLKAITGSDPLPKNSAADFWLLGPMVAQALIYNIGGHASRSELDKLCEPLKKLIVRQRLSKGWFEAALLDKNFPSEKVGVKDKNVFLQKIVNLRGARGTNSVVREFWLACRGL